MNFQTEKVLLLTNKVTEDILVLNINLFSQLEDSKAADLMKATSQLKNTCANFLTF